jgi:hypothetical protein
MERESSLARSYNALSVKHCALEEDNEREVISGARERDSIINRAYDALDVSSQSRALIFGKDLKPVIPPRPPSPRFRRFSGAGRSAMDMDLGLASGMHKSASRQIGLENPELEAFKKEQDLLVVSTSKICKSTGKSSITLPALPGLHRNMNICGIDDLGNHNSLYASQLAF